MIPLLARILVLLPAAAAEPADAPSALTFREALGIALTRGVDVERARLDARAAEADARAAEGAWQPDLGLDATSSGRVDGTGATSSFDSSLSSSMALWHGGGLRAERRAARAGATAARETEARTRQDVAWTLVTDWIALDLARAQVSVARASSALAVATRDRIQARVDTGAGTRADLAAQQAAVAEADAAIARAEGDVVLAELALVRLLRLDLEASWAFEPLDDRPPAPDAEGRALLDAALAARPDLAALAEDLDGAEAAVDAARAGRLPALDVGAALSTGWSSDVDGALPVQAEEGLAGALSVQVQVPLWDRGVTRGSVDRAEAGREAARLALDDARHEVGAEVLALLARRRTAAAVLEASTARLRAAEEAEAWTARRFEAGAAALVDLTQARTTLEDARQAEVAARYDDLALRWELAWATGALDLP